MNGIHRIAIIGLGQIGGSLVLAIRKRKLPLHITGIDISPKRVNLLSRHLDETRTSLAKAENADLVILCLHYCDIMQFLDSLPLNQLTMDVCSAKEKIIQYASTRGLRFIGGHPMAGNERAGEAGWDADLFRGQPFFLCPAPDAQSSDLKCVKNFVAALGAKGRQVDPVEHDRALAFTSHFAAFLSLLYSKTTNWCDESFRGAGYQSMTRLASTSPELLQTFLDANGKNIVDAAGEFQAMLSEWISTNSSQTNLKAEIKARQRKGR